MSIIFVNCAGLDILYHFPQEDSSHRKAAILDLFYTASSKMVLHACMRALILITLVNKDLHLQCDVNVIRFL